ncbi:hypothetical protein EJB05_27263, partial [Eragrostis curvula]
MAAAGRSPASSGRRGRPRGRGRGWSKSPRKPPLSPPASSSSPDTPSAAAAVSAPGPDPAAPLPPGAAVEVRVDDDGFHGSWFEATVVAFSPARGRRAPARYTVTYSHLLADDGGGVLAEPFAPSHVRPRPPPPPPPEGGGASSPLLRLHDIVEAFHNDGWWSGIVISPASSASAAASPTVTVAFPITREVISFPPHLVRPRRDYLGGGEWAPSRAVVAVQPKRAVRAYEVGDKVEVVRDRPDFGYSWFPATVSKVVDRLSYIIEYFDFDQEAAEGAASGGAAEKSTEYLHWRFIRPAVEHVPRESEFRLAPGAAVEAYCDGAWSPGIVRRVVGDGEYEVSIDGKEKELLVNKVAELLKPQYKWDGKQWKIVSVKRRANLRRRSLSGRSPSSPVNVVSSEDEYSHDPGSSAIKSSRNAIKKSRKEPQQQELISASVSEMEGKHDAPDNLTGNDNFLSKQIVCALTASADWQASLALDKQAPKRSTSGSNTKVLTYKKLARKKGSKKLFSPQSLLDVDSTVQQGGKENVMGNMKTHTEHDLDRSLEDTYQELLPLVPPGFESMYNGEGIDISGSLLDEELCTDRAATQVSRSSQLMVEAPIRPQNAGSSLSRCFSQISSHQVPFVKRSPAWSVIEAMDVFKEVPQQPHFFPLRDYSLAVREGMALGLMVSFATLVESIKEASIEDSMELFEDKIRSLCHLEGNGFNVQFLQARLSKLLQIKSNCSKYLGEINKLRAEMAGKATSLSRMGALLDQKDEVIGELEQRLGHLRREAQQIEKEREHEDAELSRLKSKHSRFEEAYGESVRQFRNILDDMSRRIRREAEGDASIAEKKPGVVYADMLPFSPPAPAAAYSQRQLKQLRAQCLVFLAFRNNMEPKKRYLEIALGEGPEQGTN